MQSTLSATIFGDRWDPRTRLQALFGGTVPTRAQPPDAAALHWARSLLTDTTDSATAIRQLRRAEPLLTPKAATFLAEHATRP